MFQGMGITNQRRAMIKIAKRIIIEETKMGFLLKKLNRVMINPEISRRIEDKNIKRVETKKTIQSVTEIYLFSGFIFLLLTVQITL